MPTIHLTIVTGHTPAQASLPYVAPIALYLALYRYINGPGARVQFPGTIGNYHHTYTDVSPDTMARAELYLSLVKTGESHCQAFNVADTDTPGSWSAKWPSICRYFGLEASEFVDDKWTEIDSWWYANQTAYERMCAEYGLQKQLVSPTAWSLMKMGHTLFDQNRELCLEKIRGLGFTEDHPVGSSYFRVFEDFERLRIIPPKIGLASVDAYRPRCHVPHEC